MTTKGYVLSSDTVAVLPANSVGGLTNDGSGNWSYVSYFPTGSAAALTKVDDTNVTLTLGGSPTTALLAATSLTLGWTGTLSVARGGTGTGTAFTPGSVIFAGTSGVYSQDNAEFFWDNTNDRLGIGTASPSVGLHVKGSVTDLGASFLVEATNSSTTGAANIEAIADLIDLALISNTSGRTTVRYGITIGGWGELSAFNGPSGSTNGLIIGVNTAKPLVFGTNNAERMRILSGGNVGIGTLTPNTMLEVSGAALSGDNVPSLTLNGTNASHHWAGLRFSDSGTIKWGLISDVNATDVNNLAIYDYAASLTRMYFKSDGDIGIGTESPTAVIHIKAGTATASTAPLKFTAGVNLTALESGTVEYDGSNFSGTCGTIRGTIPRVLFTQTADKTVTNTVTETSIIGTGVATGGGLTLPANALVAGRTIRLRIGGIYSTPALATPSIIIKVKYGSTTIATVTTSALLSGATNLEFDGEVLITCRTTGASGTVMVHGDVEYATGVAGTIAVDPLNNAGATTTVNTTTSNLIDITVQWDTATSTRSVTSTVTTFEVLN